MRDLGAFMRTGGGGLDAISYEISLDPEPPTLEALVDLDMRAAGIDPKRSDEICSYWDDLLVPKPLKVRQDEAQPRFMTRVISKDAKGAENVSQFDEAQFQSLLKFENPSLRSESHAT